MATVLKAILNRVTTVPLLSSHGRVMVYIDLKVMPSNCLSDAFQMLSVIG